jgi:hypothetical protein
MVSALEYLGFEEGVVLKSIDVGNRTTDDASIFGGVGA